MRSKWLGCLLVLAASACGDSPDDPAVGPVYDSGTGTVLPGPVGPGGTTGTTVVPPVTGLAGGGTLSGGVTPPGGTVTPPVGGGQNIPCDVQKILAEKCQVCHAEPPVGAPVSLTKLAHFQANSTYPGKTGEKMHQRVKARIADTAMPMPPVGRPQLTAAEKTTLNNWVSGGAVGSAQSCGGTTPPATGGTGGAATGGPGGAAAGASADCDVSQELLAHAGQTEADTSPFMAPSGGDAYEIFWFKPKWTEKVQAIRVDPVIDNGAVLHHWLLYMKDNGSEAPGSHNPDTGLQSADSQLLSGWAPGNKGFTNPPDVGLYLVPASTGRLGIEIHYNTSANPPKRADRSGARICATKKLRPKEAATHWLGTQAIFGTQAVGTCTVPKESHIIAHSPHMHKMGKHMKTIITRANGQSETITDQPFAFDDQQIFPVAPASGEHVVKPGDTITTTCDYTGFNIFGPGTDSEMCYNFVVAWPNGSLNAGAGLVGGKNTCIDGI